MAFNLPPPPVSNDPKDPSFRDWFFKLKTFLSQALDLSNVTGILGIGNGGTNTDATPTNGQLLIGNGTDYTLNTLTAGNNITITNGEGTIEIEATGGGASLNNVIDSPTTIEADTSYPIIQYLDIQDTFLVEGNVLVFDGSDTTGGGGGSTNSFSTIAVSGQSNVVADSPTDTLTLVAGSNVTITTNATTDTITISSTGGGGGSGTVTNVSSANADLTVATGTTTPVITMVQAPALRSATTTVNVSSATAPTAGQVLTATSGTAATWQTPSGGGGTYPAFSAKPNANLALTVGAFTKILFQTEDFDTNNNFASSRFTPTVAGYYLINVAVASTGNTGITELYLGKNGVQDFVTLALTQTSSILTSANGSCLVQMNGTTDYLEVYMYANSAYTVTSEASVPGQVYFQGFRIA
jgi:hypothetical protein